MCYSYWLEITLTRNNNVPAHVLASVAFVTAAHGMMMMVSLS